jgi:hypothetical protein
VGVDVEECDPCVHEAPEDLVASALELVDAFLQLLQPLHQRHAGLFSFFLRGRHLIDEAHERRRPLAGAHLRGRRHGRHDVEQRGGRGRRGGGGLGEEADHLDLGGAAAAAPEAEARGPEAVPGGGGEPCELLACPALRPERGGEARGVVAADCGEGVGDVLLELEDGLLEAAVRVSEAEEGVEEAVGAGGGGERGLGLGEAEEVGEGGVEGVDVGQAGGDGGGVLRPGPDGADVEVQVRQDRVGPARQAHGTGVPAGRHAAEGLVVIIRRRRPRRAQREGDGAREARRHCYSGLLCRASVCVSPRVCYLLPFYKEKIETAS